MVRFTSILTYSQIIDEGILAEMELRVFKIIKEFPGLCDLEYLDKDSSLTINQLTGRRNGLMEQGLVVKAGEKVSPKSGRLVTTWRVPEKIEYKEKIKKTTYQKCQLCNGTGKIKREGGIYES
jgi:hypothetical protein